MGTNFFSVKKGIEGEADFWSMRESPEVMHIGKSSGGWCFSLHVVPEQGIEDLYDWIPILTDPDRVIINEYRDTIEFYEMIKIITHRSRSEPSNWTLEDYSRNYAEPGPNNLARHTVGQGCLRQGTGTWDCIEGYFS